MNEEQQKKAVELLESASNLLYAPVALIPAGPLRDMHREAADGCLAKWDDLSEELE